MLVGATRRARPSPASGRCAGSDSPGGRQKIHRRGRQPSGIAHGVWRRGGAGGKSGTDIMLAKSALASSKPCRRTPAGRERSCKQPLSSRNGRPSCGAQTPPAVTVNLAAAKKVVCPGAALPRRRPRNDLRLARLLEAEVGATRPLTKARLACHASATSRFGRCRQAGSLPGGGVSGRRSTPSHHRSSSSSPSQGRRGAHLPQSDYGIVGDFTSRPGFDQRTQSPQ